MKINHLFVLLLIGIGLFGCQATDNITSGTLISGQLTGAANMPVHIDRLSLQLRNSTKPLYNSPADGNGNFAIGVEQGLAPGLYQLRAGAQQAVLVIEPGDNNIKINGNISELNNYGFTVKGSEASAELATAMNEMAQGGLTIEKVEETIDGVKNPTVAAFMAFTTLARAGATGMPVHDKVLPRLPETSPYRAEYAQFVNAIKAQTRQQQAAETIQVGMPAPDITAASPTGKNYSLSDLKGQVVLLDFWASWCGPCRRENPNVVKVYDKYKDQGFTIFSVSLDGLDSRRTAGLSPEQIAAGNKAQVKRWTDAIAKDKLSWPYHVSELKKWGSEAGARYGVRGIPKTFLIDREGKIAAVGLRGARQIENALQEVI